MGSPFNNEFLPEDCLQIIFQKLQNTADRSAFGLTCQCWLNVQNLACRPLIFQFSYDPDIYELYGHWLTKLLARFPHLSSIYLAGCTELPDSASADSLEYLNVSGLRNWLGADALCAICCGSVSRLGFLNLWVCRYVGDDTVASIAKGCPLPEEWNLAVCHEAWLQG